ncbi:MAG: RNA polymerase factor sigma-54 [Gammaproteobacteria bacterium]|nr:RNA polymerase factor sigma-54 [Gammaproteobacteria bacterium]NIM72205.1 RNA polymerase factor sigma-54 [Gammaproteobacteria bacterium]NIN39120.1 RNA polymerase factor sigma-54 [Gammaproteobacteria bacterium]NIO23953.1 RNA polymerase factor sigma-54 [Gammaproteobacteria bacterium]NIO64605.1 RNA polymerase factor sigma-54 [Gammaproteobacteria bacterium]
MKQSLQLRLGQHLTMTPQLQQAIRLLQLSTMELQMEVQEALESNLMLELEDEGASSTTGDSPADGGASEQDVAPEDIPSELPVDSAWEDIYDGVPVHHGGSEVNGTEFENPRAESETLKDHLLWQLGLTRMSELDQVIATAIIDSIDEGGYLGATLEDIHKSLSTPELEIDLAEIAAVLHQVQNFDPVGVAARDPRECLLIQLRQRPDNTPWLQAAVTLVEDHLDLLGQRDYAQLMRLLKLEKEELQRVIELIKTLSPRPGDALQSNPPEYVIPDVIVRKVKGTWRVELNPDAFPKVRVNSQYASLIRRADNSADNNCLKTHLQEARWLIKSLKSRSETLLKVATCIVKRQQAFFEYGEEAMKPMVLHDIAEEVEMHESTISRVTTQKFMHTPRGLYELKYFFSSHVHTESGAECSSTAIRALLKKLIAAENSQKPLSDSKLAAILSEQGIKVARRTVAKYRESMAIPSSSERKSLM